MGRDIRIEEVNGGFMIRAWDGGSLYGPEMAADKKNEIVVTTSAEAKDFFDKWLRKEAPPFVKDTPK